LGNSSILRRALAQLNWPLFAIALAASACGFAPAEEVGNAPTNRGGGPVYQRHAYGGPSPHENWRGGWGNSPHPNVTQQNQLQINAGSFQRPYPYHLDYYRMRYGGSYAPYFGNLYGPPQVVTAPPYYGPYYGGYGFQGDAFQGAYGAAPFNCPCLPNGPADAAGPVEQKSGGPAAQ
jgi:hypothetical protein